MKSGCVSGADKEESIPISGMAILVHLPSHELVKTVLNRLSVGGAILSSFSLIRLQMTRAAARLCEISTGIRGSCVFESGLSILAQLVRELHRGIYLNTLRETHDFPVCFPENAQSIYEPHASTSR